MTNHSIYIIIVVSADGGWSRDGVVDGTEGEDPQGPVLGQYQDNDG